MGDNGDDTGDLADTGDPFAERRAGFEAQFRALPPPGTLAYWQALQGTVNAPMPLEVLARCWRERWRARAEGDAERVFALLWGRLQGPLQRWARRCLGATGATGAPSNLPDDLEAMCFEGVWKELARATEPFLLENFRHGLEYIQQHALHAVLNQEGLQNRKDVKQSTRIPRAAQESLSASHATDDEEYTLAEITADGAAQERFDLDVACSDLRDLLSKLSDEERALLYYDIEGELTQDEIGQRLGITGRTVRNKLKQLRAWLRAEYDGPKNSATRSDAEGTDHGQH